jgi:Ca2+-binding EF-hand superfamily protein
MCKSSPLVKIVPALLALILLGTPLALRAEGEASRKLTKNQEKYDADQDGKLSEEEKAAAKAGATAKAKETREANLEKYDTNKNGKLDADEKAKKQADDAAERDAQKAAREARKSEKK